MDDEALFEGDPPAAAEPGVIPDRRELALVAVERTRMPMVVTDPKQPDNPIVMANAAFLTLTGYAAEEVIGHNCRFLQGPGTDPASVDVIRRGLAEEADHIAVEMLNYRKDGTEFWNQLAMSRVTDESGHLVYYFASQKDVTESRRIEHMEAVERQLLMEVDHRAMNALTLVKSIVRLTRSGSIADYSSSILGRVDALARAHRLLASSSWAGADLAQLVSGEIPVEDRAARIAVDGTPFQLPAPLVQPLALALHELMSNARKHGALAHDSGRVSVSWEEQPGSLTLDWAENGGPDLDPPPKLGFGLRTLTGVIEHQLAGKISTSWTPPGFRARITVPTPATEATAVP